MARKKETFFLSKSILLCHLPSPGLLRKLGSGDFPYFLHGAYCPNTENVLVFPIFLLYIWLYFIECPLGLHFKQFHKSVEKTY